MTRQSTTMLGILRRSFLFWFGGIWFVVGLPFAIAAAIMFVNDRALTREGRIVQGMVLSKDVDRSTREGRTSTSYYVRYRFFAGDEVIEGRSQLDFDEWNALIERGPIELIYRESRPSSNRPTAHGSRLLIGIFGAVGTFFAGVGGALVVRSIRSARDEQIVRTHGVNANGRVVSVTPTNTRFNGRQQWRLQYEFADGQGGTRTARATIDAAEAERWKPGDAGQVRFDPDRPSRSVWLGRDVYA